MKLSKNINIGKLKVKYVLGMQSKISSYPDYEDILYELIKSYSDKISHELKFTDISLKKRFNLTDTFLNEILEWLILNGFSDIVNKTASYTTYKIIKNPYE